MKEETIKTIENYKIDYKKNFFTINTTKKMKSSIIKNYIYSSLKAII